MINRSVTKRLVVIVTMITMGVKNGDQFDDMKLWLYVYTKVVGST
jgi:hypothetical protein